MGQRTVIYDIETNSVDTNVAVPVLFGWYTSDDDEFHWTDCIDVMVQTLNDADIIVGYNNIDFDNEIMKRFGASFRGKINIDLMQILHGKGFGNDLGRKTICITPSGKHMGQVLHGKSLADTAAAIGRSQKIQDFDYSLFQKRFDSLDIKQQAKCLEYLEADLQDTKAIYEYLENFFHDFGHGGVTIEGHWLPFMDESWVRQKKYLTWSVASMVYHILCNLADIEPRFQEAERADYGGGFVADPSREVAEGDIYCLDYNSLYPHIMMQANLYGKYNGENDQQYWKGKGISETIGQYGKEKESPVGRVLRALYAKRLDYKKDKDGREYTIKIVINTIYGLLGNPVFASVADYVAAADCTRLGRQWVNAARQHFMEHGYDVLYTDTDSVYLRDPFNDKQRLLGVKDKHIADIKASVPFPQDTFDMGIDDEIRYMAFFKDRGGKLKKKNYLYVTKAGKLKLKGLPIIKSNATPLGKLIFDKFIKDEIITNNRHKFPKSQIENWITAELRKDVTLASVFYKVKEVAMYANASQIQAQIAMHKLYGPGQHRLVKMKSRHEKGCGTHGNYVGVQYADEIKLSHIDLDKTWSELEPFVGSEQKSLSAFF